MPRLRGAWRATARGTQAVDLRTGLVTLVACLAFATPVADHDPIRDGLQEVVEPLGLSALFGRHLARSAHASEEADQGGLVRGHDVARDHASGGVAHRNDRRCLVHIQPHILRRAFHESRSLLGPFSQGRLRPLPGTRKGRALKIRYVKSLQVVLSEIRADGRG